MSRTGPTLLNATAEGREELESLYRTALKNISVQVPPEYGTLLQLQEMLGIDRRRAEEIEAQEMGGSNFSI